MLWRMHSSIKKTFLTFLYIKNVELQPLRAWKNVLPGHYFPRLFISLVYLDNPSEVSCTIIKLSGTVSSNENTLSNMKPS